MAERSVDRSVASVAKIIFWGGTGQARVLRPIVEALGKRLVAIFDDNEQLESPFPDVPVITGGWKAFERWLAEVDFKPEFAVPMGRDRGEMRCTIGRRLERAGLQPAQAIHSTAWIAASASLGAGSQILARATISESARLGDYVIVNTSASIDHDCDIGHGVHVMPGAVLAGVVKVGDFASIGTNATILPNLKVGPGAFVGAGAVVVRDVPAKAVVVGNPARRVAKDDATAIRRAK